MTTEWLNYVVMAVTLVVWGGLFVVIFRLDKRVRKLERE